MPRAPARKRPTASSRRSLRCTAVLGTRTPPLEAKLRRVIREVVLDRLHPSWLLVVQAHCMSTIATAIRCRRSRFCVPSSAARLRHEWDKLRSWARPRICSGRRCGSEAGAELPLLRLVAGEG